MTIMRKIRTKLIDFYFIIYSCLKISWNSSRLFFCLKIVFEISESIFPFLYLLISKSLIDILVSIIQNTNNELQIKKFCKMLILSMALLLIHKIFIKIKEYCESLYSDLLENQINMQISQKTLELDLSFFDNAQFQIDIENAKKDSAVLKNFIWNIISSIRYLIQVIISFSILSQLNIYITMLMVILVIPIIFLESKYKNLIYCLDRKWVKEDRKMNYLLNLLIYPNFARDIRIYNIGTFITDKYLNTWKGKISEKKTILKKRSLLVGLLSIFPDLISIYLIFYIGMQIVHGKLTLGDYSFFTGISTQLTANISILVTMISILYENKLKIINYNKFFNLKSNIPNGKLVLNSVDKIEFSNVSFKYPGTEKYILRNFNLVINKSDRIAIVGPNGSGKTTIIKLLLQFYLPTEGKIIINDKDLNLYDIDNFRRHFSVLFQDYSNFAFTAKESIVISALEEIENSTLLDQALNKSDSKKMISKFENGINTYLSRQFEQDGKELSGGEWQKIALARAFFRNGDFVILDEPSASLDPETEHKIFNMLYQFSRDKSVLLITHRLSNITMVDKIILLEDGMVIEEGSHSQLIKKNGKYAFLYKLQADKYRL